MSLLGWNLLLALAWCAIHGALTLVNFGVGFVVAYLVLAWFRPGEVSRAYVRRLPLALAFAAFYAWELLRSTLRVAWDIVTPGARRRPGIVRVPLDLQTDIEIAVLSNLLTFTPGTLALDVTDDRTCMIVHDMFIDDPDRTRERIKRRFERRVMRILR